MGTNSDKKNICVGIQIIDLIELIGTYIKYLIGIEKETHLSHKSKFSYESFTARTSATLVCHYPL